MGLRWFSSGNKSDANERQKKAIEYISKYGKITTKEYVHLVNTSTITAKRDLLDLKSKNIIKFKGSAKTGYYVLNGNVNDTVNDTVKGNVRDNVKED